MALNFSQKSCEASVRVLETLKLFMTKNLSIQDIINYFEVNEHHCKAYTSEAILKYLNTMKIFGLNFIKPKDKYILMNSPVTLDFTEQELSAIKIFESYAKSLPEKKLKNDISIFLQNLEKFFSQKTLAIANKSSFMDFYFDEKFKKHEKEIVQYEQNCADKLKLKIEYRLYNKTLTSILAEPKEISYKGTKVYLRIYNPISAKIQDLNFNNIIKVEQLPLKSNLTNIIMSVTYRLYGRLAKGYRLHDGERITNTDGENLTVINQVEDEEHLLRRLMRYGSLCEVISPKSVREEMRKLIEMSIKNCNVQP